MSFLDNYDATNAPTVGFDPLPNGAYPCTVQKVEEKKEGDDKTTIKATYIVSDGPYKNRRIFHDMRVKWPSEKGQAYGQAHLGMLCKAIGNLKPRDYFEFANKPVVVHLVCKEFNGKIKNEVEKVEAPSTTASAPAVTDKPWG